MANKKENIKNLVKRMFLSISMMSFFVSAGVENVSAMRSIFGDVSGKSDNGQQNTTPGAAPVSVTPNNSTPANYRGAMPVAGSDLPILDENIKDENIKGETKILIDTKNKSENDKNESILGSLVDKSESFCSEGYSVRFIFPIPEASKDVTNIVNGDVVAEYLKNIDSVDDIPACMYDHILKALDQQNSDKNITILLLELYGVNVDGFLERDKSVSLLAKTLYATFKEAQENSK